MKVLMAWEVGRNFGHISMLVNLAKSIVKKNEKAEIIFALQKPETALKFASRFEYKLLQAPYFPVRPMPPRNKYKSSKLFSDDLWPCGYHDPEILAGLIRSWSDLYDLVKPKILITQAAPTALLAAREYKFKKVSFGGGYDVPAKADPMPPLRYWEENNPEEMQGRAAEVLDVINQAQKKLKRPKLKSFMQAIETDADYLATFEELDHFPNRAEIEGRESKYYGGNFSIDKGENLKWNENVDHRVFAYIRPDAQGFKECMEALSMVSSKTDMIVSAPGIPAAIKQKLEKPHLRIIDGPVKFASILKDCDLGITHAGQGTCYAFAVHGVPQLLLPGHIEQFMFAKAAGRQKLGRGLAGKYTTQNVIELIKTLTTDPQYKEASQAFAEKYKKFNPNKLSDTLADDILKLIKPRS